MRKLSGILITLLFTSLAFGQSHNVKVVEHTAKVQKVDHVGLAVHIDLDKSFVNNGWKKELKSLGKVSTSKGTYVMEAANFPAASGSPCRILSQVSSTGKGARVWMSVNTGEGKVKEGSRGYNGTKSFLEDFAKKIYRADVEEQIAEAQKAVDDSKKNHKKLVSNGESLQKDLQKNAEEKVKLEEAITKNKADQEQAVKDVSQMEKAHEVVKGKLNAIK